MLVYSDSDILEILPQQVITSEKIIEHSNLKLVEAPKAPKKKKYIKKQPKEN